MSLLQNSNAIESGTAYSVNNSIRLRQSATANLTRTFTNSNTSFTLSMWIKRGSLGIDASLFAIDSSNLIRFDNATDGIQFKMGSTTARGVTTAVFRDSSAWYHFVVSRNGGQGGTTSVWNAYINNQSVFTYTGNGGTFSSGVSHIIGSVAGTSYLDGYMAEVYYVDGQALTPSSFGETDGTTGVWKPKAYTGTYGTNGFYLPFKATAGSVTLKSSQISKQTSNSTTIAVTVPSVSDGDLMVMIVNSGGASTATWTTPSGWTAGVNNASGRAVFYRRASSEPASYTVTQSATNTADGTILVFTNADYDTDGANSGNAPDAAPGTITVASNNSTIAYVVFDNASRTVTSAPTGYTSVIADGDATGPNQYVYTLANVAAGSYTAPNSVTSAAMRRFIIAIKPKLIVGADYSGNNNTWNTTTISTTNDTTYDLMIDSPMMGTSDTQPVGNYAIVNPLEKGSLTTISAANLNISIGSGKGAARSSLGVSSGKWYFEVTGSITATNGIAVGYSTQSYNLSAATDLGASNNSFCVRAGYTTAPGNDFVLFNGTTTNLSSDFTANTDVLGMALDVDTGALTIYKNNSSVYSGTLSLPSGQTWFATFANLTGTSTKTFEVNFGQRPFTYTPPSGYKALCTTNLPDSTIIKGNSYMDATLWTGDGSAQTITNAGSFKPDFVWWKNRNSTRNHLLFDSIRGVGNYIQSNTTAAEATDAQMLTSFNTDGFTHGTATNGATNGETYVGWQWKANQGTNVTNTNGSITSTVSVNTTAGFSIVTYTGITAAGTIGHGLGVAPSMIITKSRSAAGNNWGVYHISLGAANKLTLQSTAASAASSNWNSTTPTSSVFSVGSSNTDSNANGVTYVAYCFAEIPGFSKFGSYIGNGSTDGPFNYLGFRPKFVIIKRTDGLGQWSITDSSRSPTNLAQARLQASSSNNEGTQDPIDFLSNGIKARAANTDCNVNGSTYIYMAFAENPFKYSLAR